MGAVVSRDGAHSRKANVRRSGDGSYKRMPLLPFDYGRPLVDYGDSDDVDSDRHQSSFFLVNRKAKLSLRPDVFSNKSAFQQGLCGCIDSYAPENLVHSESASTIASLAEATSNSGRRPSASGRTGRRLSGDSSASNEGSPVGVVSRRLSTVSINSDPGNASPIASDPGPKPLIILDPWCPGVLFVGTKKDFKSAKPLLRIVIEPKAPYSKMLCAKVKRCIDRDTVTCPGPGERFLRPTSKLPAKYAGSTGAEHLPSASGPTLFQIELEPLHENAGAANSAESSPAYGAPYTVGLKELGAFPEELCFSFPKNVTARSMCQVMQRLSNMSGGAVFEEDSPLNALITDGCNIVCGGKKISEDGPLYQPEAIARLTVVRVDQSNVQNSGTVGAPETQIQSQKADNSPPESAGASSIVAAGNETPGRALSDSQESAVTGTTDTTDSGSTSSDSQGKNNRQELAVEVAKGVDITVVVAMIVGWQMLVTKQRTVENRERERLEREKEK